MCSTTPETSEAETRTAKRERRKKTVAIARKRQLWKEVQSLSLISLMSGLFFTFIFNLIVTVRYEKNASSWWFNFLSEFFKEVY